MVNQRQWIRIFYVIAEGSEAQLNILSKSTHTGAYLKALITFWILDIGGYSSLLEQTGLRF